jgi:HSP20 family protein
MNRRLESVMNLHRPVLSPSSNGWVPEADIIETEEEVRIHVNLAGVSKEDIEVSYDETYLRVVGTRFPGLPPGTRARYHQMEMGSGSFERIFTIPARIDPERIEASFEDGLLTIRLGKPGYGKEPRKVEVHD